MRMALTGGSSTHSRLGEGTVVGSALGESWGLGRSSLSGLVSLGHSHGADLLEGTSVSVEEKDRVTTCSYLLSALPDIFLASHNCPLHSVVSH